MRIIALFGRGNIGKTWCLGHLINLIHRETKGYNCLFEGQDTRISLEYLGQRVTICTWGDNDKEEQLNLDKIKQDNPNIAIVATRTKGETVKMVERFCNLNNCRLKWVEKHVANFDDISGQEYVNHLQAEQILDYVKGLIKGQLYYVDSMSTIGREEGLYHVTLMGVEDLNYVYPRTLSLELNANQLHYQDNGQMVQEDDFVLYHPDSDILFGYGNDMPRATAIRNESRDLRRELIEREVKGEEAIAVIREECKWVKSYHVKVGHGNCSLILIKYQKGYDLWMVDCSTYDYLNRRDYSQDLYHCLADIAKELEIGMTDLWISRFMLTHTHFDHYNGIPYLIEHGLIIGKTLVYVNLHYECSSTTWSRILKGLKEMKCKFVEPISDNLIYGAIKIYHPECRIYRNSNSVPAEKKIQYRIVPKANDASVVYGINLLGKVMVLPGDLEKKGFKEMSGHDPCRGNLVDTVYYLVSHHGSQNGHPDVMCMSKGGPNPKPLCCVSQNVKKVILTGRNGAYSGIYSQTVIDYWENTLGVLEYTERTPHYLELNWSDDTMAMM